MINWHRITKDNFTEFLNEWSLEEIKQDGIVLNTYYYSCYENSKYVFLSDENCIVTEAEICVNKDGTVDCREFKAECSYHNLTHFALRTEYLAILPKDRK
jgi:hypothetical protein